MSNSEIEQSGTVKGHLSNVLSLSGHISIGSGSGDFIIRMTIEVNGNNYTVTSCDKTMEQIDAAVASGQNIKAIAFDKFIMPLTQIMENGESYTFGAFLGSFLVMANVSKNPESGADEWQFYLIPLAADIVEYSNDAMPRISTVGEALDELVPNSHTHSNKAVLDKFSETDGKPTYDGKALGGGASTAEDISYTLSEDVQTTFPDIIELESDTVKSGLDVAMYYALAGMFAKYIGCDLQSGSGETVSMDLQRILDGFVFPAMFKAHEHDNKSVLDLISAVDGKLRYNGSDVGLKGDKGADGADGKDGTNGKTPVKGTDYWTESDKAEIVNDTLAALPTWTGGNY